MTPSQKLAALGLALPEVAVPVAAYLPAVVHGGLVWTSGQLPTVNGTLVRTGLVGSPPDHVDPSEAVELARICALNALAAVASVAGEKGIDGIERIVKVVGYVASAVGFHGQAGVVDGASRLLADVFGDAGRSARSAVGVAGLPLGTPVEIELVAALTDDHVR